MAYRSGLAVLPAEKRGASAPSFAMRPFSIESGEHKIKLDYEYHVEVRYGAGRPPHCRLDSIVAAGRVGYAAIIDEIARLRSDFAGVQMSAPSTATVPFWINEWFPPLDAMALHAMCARRPKVLVEVGSGLSTKFAHWSITHHGLATRIISIDPQPRCNIDRVVTEILPRPLERIPPAWFDTLDKNDILFIDSSHRSFQNSDVTAFFLDILPRLKPGVLVHIHDIYLPEDYPASCLGTLWNEQYLLAAALLYGGAGLEILFPCWYVSKDPELSANLHQGLRRGRLAGLHLWGASFWLRKT
jgi:hypothetical protein